jgi:hypothetical protein
VGVAVEVTVGRGVAEGGIGVEVKVGVGGNGVGVRVKVGTGVKVWAASGVSNGGTASEVGHHSGAVTITAAVIQANTRATRPPKITTWVKRRGDID